MWYLGISLPIVPWEIWLLDVKCQVEWSTVYPISIHLPLVPTCYLTYTCGLWLISQSVVNASSGAKSIRDCPSIELFTSSLLVLTTVDLVSTHCENFRGISRQQIFFPLCTSCGSNLRWTWKLIHMKSIWNHISITSHEICLNYIKNSVNFIWHKKSKSNLGTAYVTFTGEIWSVHCEDFREKISCYTQFLQYIYSQNTLKPGDISVNWVIIALGKIFIQESFFRHQCVESNLSVLCHPIPSWIPFQRPAVQRQILCNSIATNQIIPWPVNLGGDITLHWVWCRKVIRWI